MLVESSPAGLDEGRTSAPHGQSESANGSRAAGEGAGAIRFPPPRAEHDVKQPYIKRLRIRDYALIAEEEVELAPGLNVVTGESGAGKSVLVTCLGQLLGAPAVENCIRPPASSAVIEGTVHLPANAVEACRKALVSMGSPAKVLPAASDGAMEVLLRREIVYANGAGGSVRSKCSINGYSTSLRVFRELGALLVDVNGQHAAQTLRNPDTQLALLDRLAGTDAAVSQYSAKLEQLRVAHAQLAAIDALGDFQQRARLQALVDQVRQAEVAAGEESELRQRLRQMEARQASVQRCGVVAATQASLQEGLRAVQTQLNAILAEEQAQTDALAEEIAEEDPVLDNSGAELMEAALEELGLARDHLTALEEKVEAYAQHFRFLQLEHDEVSQRLKQLERLLKQHSCLTSEQLLEKTAKAESSLDQWFQMEGKRGDVQATVRQLKAELAHEAVQLSQRRRAAAGSLRAAVESCLADLSMAGSRFDVRIGWEEHAKGLLVSEELASKVHEAGSQAYRVKKTGLDSVEFLLAAGPAEALRPLGAVASGGETARVMMALKAAPASVLANSAHSSAGDFGGSGPPVMILDELDSGVGARLGTPIALLLSQMASAKHAGLTSQIICISHLPQVAASADHHIVVKKALDGEGRALTRIRILLQEQERLAEVAAMMGVGQQDALQVLQASGAQPRAGYVGGM
ncbi:g1171 [Coccomyxa viridis]|uniref:DNA repair protein RecN n=1 Tax=Coccomyxa viridis TaxID=1274662 RepID=A0ABP1FHE1_9CHLO